MVRNAKLTVLNIGKILFVSFLFHILPCQNSHAQVYGGYKGSLSASIGMANHFNPAARNFLKDSLNLDNLDKFNYGFTAAGFVNSLSIRFTFAINQFTASNDHSSYRINQFLDMVGIGWNHDIGTIFGFSTSLNFGVHWTSQRYRLASSETDLYQSITTQDFKEISSISKPRFVLAQDVRLDAKVYQNISIFTQCAFAYIQAGERPKINGIKLLGNSNYISLGISYALKANP